MQLFERLKSERERLGYSQSEFAELVKATRKTVFNWESGSGTPGADVLAVWANVGLDVLYVVTGDHSFVPPPKYSAKEQLLIEYFQQASEATQKKLLRIALEDESATAANAPKREKKPDAAGIPGISIGHVGGSSQIVSGNITNHGPMSFGAPTPPSKKAK